MKGQKTGGRTRGSQNKATAELRVAAQRFTKSALATLAGLMVNAQNEGARIMAARELLDRGHGKAPQAMTDADGGNLPVATTVIHVHQP